MITAEQMKAKAQQVLDERQSKVDAFVADNKPQLMAELEAGALLAAAQGRFFDSHVSQYDRAVVPFNFVEALATSVRSDLKEAGYHTYSKIDTFADIWSLNLEVTWR